MPDDLYGRAFDVQVFDGSRSALSQLRPGPFDVNPGLVRTVLKRGFFDNDFHAFLPPADEFEKCMLESLKISDI
jgi:hypothetical protein